MIEKKSNPDETINGFTPQALTEDLLQQVNGGLISSANLPHAPEPSKLPPNLGDYADWYYYNAGFGAMGGSSF